MCGENMIALTAFLYADEQNELSLKLDGGVVVLLDVVVFSVR